MEYKAIGLKVHGQQTELNVLLFSFLLSVFLNYYMGNLSTKWLFFSSTVIGVGNGQLLVALSC